MSHKQLSDRSILQSNKLIVVFGTTGYIWLHTVLTDLLLTYCSY